MLYQLLQRTEGAQIIPALKYCYVQFKYFVLGQQIEHLGWKKPEGRGQEDDDIPLYSRALASIQQDWEQGKVILKTLKKSKYAIEIWFHFVLNFLLLKCDY